MNGGALAAEVSRSNVLVDVQVPIHHSPDRPGQSKRRMKADDVDFSADLDSEFGEDLEEASINSSKLVTSSPFLLNDRRRTLSTRQRSGAVQSITVPLVVAEKQKSDDVSVKSPSVSAQRIDVIRMKLTPSTGSVKADKLDDDHSMGPECRDMADPVSKSDSSAESAGDRQSADDTGSKAQTVVPNGSETIDVEVQRPHIAVTTAPIHEQKTLSMKKEEECELLDSFDSATLDDSVGETMPIQDRPTSYGEREQEGELLDFDSDTMDGEYVQTSEQATSPLHQQGSSLAHREPGGELLDVDSDLLFGGESMQDRQIGWVQPPKPTRTNSEHSIIDLEDSETIVCAGSGEGELLDMETDLSLAPSTNETPPQIEECPQDSSPEEEKLVELRRKQEHDAAQTRAELAQQNDRIAAKLMGESLPSQNKTDLSGQTELDRETKLTAQREANSSNVATRQASLANQNDRMASKISEPVLLQDKVQQRSAARQAALADATHRTAVKMTAALPDTAAVTQLPAETDVAVNASPELDLEHGVLSSPVVAEPVDNSFLPSALEYDNNVKPRLIRNRRFRLYAGVTAAMICVGAISISVGIKRARREYHGLSFRETLGMRETLETVMGQEAFLDPSNHQSRALRWIIHHDKLQIKPDDATFVQRFLAASFYFATTESSDWESACAPSPQYEAPNECEVVTVLAPGREVSTHGMRWLSGESECSWFGVQCDELKQIRTIESKGMKIMGPIPENLHTFFPSLQNLRLQTNALDGPLPEELFSSARHLAEANLDGNSFTGSIPESLYRSQTLRRVYLNDNKLVGTLSSSIEFSRTMKLFGIMRNQLSGTIPSEISTHHSWFTLELRGNQLEGTLPDDIGGFRVFDVHDNLLTGTIPAAWVNATDLQELYVGHNALSGSIPDELFANPSLRLLDAERNQLGGPLSPALTQVPDPFFYLNIADNAFTGTIPVEWASIPNLALARLDNNNLNGTMPLCTAGRQQHNLTDLQLLTATCNEDLVCECCDTSCQPQLVLENGDPVANGLANSGAP